MGQPRQGMDFAADSRKMALLRHPHGLERHRLASGMVLRAIDDSHPAFAKQTVDDVRADACRQLQLCCDHLFPLLQPNIMEDREALQKDLLPPTLEALRREFFSGPLY